MSLWDIVAGFSTEKNLKDPDSKKSEKWKKWNSASVDLVNGDGLAFTNEGGYTWNIFGANVNFVCDLEALLEGAIASKWPGKIAAGVLGTIFGPGANNTITIGNTLTLNYMVGHSNNFTVMRGNPEISIKYFHGHLESDVGEGYQSDKTKTSRWMWAFIAAFALLIAGFDIALNVLKNQINGEEEKVHKDQAEIEKYKAKVEAEQKEAEAQGQVVNPDAGGVAVEPTHAQEELEHAKHQEHSDEATLKNKEKWYEWIIYTSIIAENRSILVLKLLEQFYAGVKAIETELKGANNTIAKIKTGLEASEKSAEDDSTIANLEAQIKAVEDNLYELQELCLKGYEGTLDSIFTQFIVATNLKEQLKKKIADSARVAVQVVAQVDQSANLISTE